MGSGPLDHPRLLEIEEKLDQSEIEAAQRLLADLGDLPVHRTAITYFATRLLYQRGRLDALGVVERLRELMAVEPLFPQASAMLAAAERGTLRPDRIGFQRAAHEDAASERSSAPPPSLAAWSKPAGKEPSAPTLEVAPNFDDDDAFAEGFATDADELEPLEEPSSTQTLFGRNERQSRERNLSAPEIPRAPIVPRITPPSSGAASYAPSLRHGSAQFEFELELPADPRDTVRQAAPSTLPPSNVQPTMSPPTASERPPSSIRTHSPESLLTRARGLWDKGKRERALSHALRLEGAPLLDPELRAECARFLIDAEEPERALAQARQAVADDPDLPLAQLMMTWALVRAARRAPNAQLIDEAELLLARLRARAGPIPALAQALRAAILAEKGDAARAVGTAKLALKLDPAAPDAEAAIALAAARLGDFVEARAAFERLAALSTTEAENLRDRLQQLGVTLDDGGVSSSRGESSALRLWADVEVALFSGERDHVIATFEQNATRELRGLVGESATGAIPLLATMASSFFTSEPIWRHFAPYDLSLGSIARVDAVLDILYGRSSRPALTSASLAAHVMLSSYVGECLRQGYGGRWLGSLAAPETVFVDTERARFAPFHATRLRLEHGRRLLFDIAPGQRARVSGAPITMPVAPPAPWDPARWPSRRMLPRLGRAFSQSVVELYCAEFGGGSLDRSLGGLSSLDAYAKLLAPVDTHAPVGARWVERAAVLVGAYLGEVLREATGAVWRDEADTPTGPESYALLLPDGGSTYPVLQAFDRLSGKDANSLGRYAIRLVRDRG